MFTSLATLDRFVNTNIDTLQLAKFRGET